MSDLARRLVEHPRWPGDTPGIQWECCGFVQQHSYEEPPECCGCPNPDIEHPATKGWLLAMLREATGDPGLHAAMLLPIGNQQPESWATYALCPLPTWPFHTEGEALAAALLLVWGEP